MYFVCSSNFFSSSFYNLESYSFPRLRVQDTFDILACKEIRLSVNRGLSSESGDADEEGGDNGGASAAAARGKVITHAVRKSLIQNTIPIFIELKRLMESKNSPLIGMKSTLNFT